MADVTIELPNGWRARDHQRPTWEYMKRGGLRACNVWHRRSGKDSTALNWTCRAAHVRKGVYWHLLPEAEQARKAVWDNIDAGERKMIDQVFPVELRKSTHVNEMKIELKCGSVWQLAGSDNYNSLVGSNPVGVVISEYSLSKPSAWDYIRPILAENGGWAMFNFTPRGQNHAFDLYQVAKKNPDWFTDLLTVDDTDALIRNPSLIDDERASGMAEEMIEQEYYCSFDAANVGSYYGKLMRAAEQAGRVGVWPWLEDRPVHTAWDIGRSDAAVCWFFQVELIGGVSRVRFIACHIVQGSDVDYWIEYLRSQPYRYADPALWLPHDAKQKTMSNRGRSVQNQFKAGGFHSRIAPAVSVNDGIAAARYTLKTCVFDEQGCGDGLAALKLYQKVWNADLKRFQNNPRHDWTSDPADAFRMASLAWRDEMEQKPKPPVVFPVRAADTPGVIIMPTFDQLRAMVRARTQGER